MSVGIRKLEKGEHEYISYAKLHGEKATCLLYFVDGIWGAVVLCNVITMLKSFFGATGLKITVDERVLSLKNEKIQALLEEQS